MCIKRYGARVVSIILRLTPSIQTQPVGRIYGVSHNNIELFALRRLLGIVKGALSFEDLATLDGVLYSSFREVCMGFVFESDPFTHGQLYVALSRVAGWSSIVAHYHGRDNVKNCVLRHLLQ